MHVPDSDCACPRIHCSRQSCLGPSTVRTQAAVASCQQAALCGSLVGHAMRATGFASWAATAAHMSQHT